MKYCKEKKDTTERKYSTFHIQKRQQTWPPALFNSQGHWLISRKLLDVAYNSWLLGPSNGWLTFLTTCLKSQNIIFLCYQTSCVCKLRTYARLTTYTLWSCMARSSKGCCSLSAGKPGAKGSPSTGRTFNHGREYHGGCAQHAELGASDKVHQQSQTQQRAQTGAKWNDVTDRAERKATTQVQNPSCQQGQW